MSAKRIKIALYRRADDDVAVDTFVRDLPVEQSEVDEFFSAVIEKLRLFNNEDMAAVDGKFPCFKIAIWNDPENWIAKDTLVLNYTGRGGSIPDGLNDWINDRIKRIELLSASAVAFP